MNEEISDLKRYTVIILPVPPAGNNFYAVVRGRKIISKAGRDWQKAAAPLLYGMKKLHGELSITFRWYRAIRSGDLDNRLKPCQDILKGVLFDDDKQIIELHAYRFEDKINPRIEVEVRQVDRAAE